MSLAGNELDRADQFFWIRAVQQEGIRLNGLVREAAAARLFPGQVFIVKSDIVAGPSQPLSAHGAGRSSTHDCDITHANASMKRAEPGTGPGAGMKGSIARGDESRNLEPRREYNRKYR